MAKHTFKNISTGIRGFHSVDGLVELLPGTSTEADVTDGELASSSRTDWFEIDGSTDAVGAGPSDDLDTTIAELRKIATAEDVDLAGLTAKADIQGAIRIAREGKGEPKGNDLDGMDDATLLTTAAAITGKPEAELAGTDRADLLKLARGEA